VRTVLSNPRYTGRQVWNRQPTSHDLIDPANTGLGHRQVQRWTLPDGWIISARPAHTPLVSEQDFVAAQGIHAQRDSATAADHRYQLAGLLRCGICGRRLESCWANNRPAYRCRHGHTSATPRDPNRPKNLYVREDRLLPRLPALYNALVGAEPAAGRTRRRTRSGIDVEPPVSETDMISSFRSWDITLTYDPVAQTVQTETPDTTTTTASRAS
jgi:site-specific DNA recombinase